MNEYASELAWFHIVAIQHFYGAKSSEKSVFKSDGGCGECVELNCLKQFMCFLRLWLHGVCNAVVANRIGIFITAFSKVLDLANSFLGL